MSTELKKYTFKSLIGSQFETADNEVVQIKEIIIPRIQRDYAQGRTGKFEKRVRSRFLDALYTAINNNQNIILDFVYGDVDKEKGELTLLDGQQRLTTLFLLHWYASKKCKIDNQSIDFLKHFSYATRFSSRDFCKFIIDNEISFDVSKISEEIKNQAWYQYDWKNDPTIESMLIMIDDINEKFNQVNNLWKLLVDDNCISFYFLPLENMGLSDELYIKMNSRGKPLTEFEHFKAEFLEIIKEQNEELYKEFSRKIDIDWTYMLFPYRGENQIIDDEFMRYFKYISHILCYKTIIENRDDNLEYDEFKLAKQLYSKGNSNSISNLNFLKSAFDCWCGIDIDNFFDSIFYTSSYVTDKTKLYLKSDGSINLFLDCCNHHAEFTENGRNRLFSLNTMLLFYGVLIYRLNIQTLSEDDFKRRIRIVRNLTENSQYEIREFDQDGSNQMRRLLSDVEDIILKGTLRTEDRGFNILQKREEQKKLEWLPKNSDYKDELYKLEDHNLLKGTISIIGLDNPDNFSKFALLFEQTDKDLINKALLTIGDYSQNLSWRTQLGVKTKDTVWADLFHPTEQRNKDNRFQNTSKILNELLTSIPDNCSNIDEFLEKRITDYLENTKDSFDWKYYFIKYEQMRYDTYGMYYWKDKAKNPYVVVIMHTEKAINGKNWNAFAYTLYNLYQDYFDLENYAYSGDKLHIKDTNKYIDIQNDCFEIFEEGKDPVIIKFKQNNGLDQEDRIESIIQQVKKM